MSGQGEKQKKILWAPWRMAYIRQSRRHCQRIPGNLAGARHGTPRPICAAQLKTKRAISIQARSAGQAAARQELRPDGLTIGLTGD